MWACQSVKQASKSQGLTLEPGQLHRARRWAHGGRKQSDRSQARCWGRSPHGTMTSVWSSVCRTGVWRQVCKHLSQRDLREQCKTSVFVKLVLCVLDAYAWDVRKYGYFSVIEQSIWKPVSSRKILLNEHLYRGNTWQNVWKLQKSVR